MITEEKYRKILNAKETLCGFCGGEGDYCEDCLLTYFERDALAEYHRGKDSNEKKKQKMDFH